MGWWSLFFLSGGYRGPPLPLNSSGIRDDLRIAAIFQWGRRPSSSWCGVSLVSFNTSRNLTPSVSSFCSFAFEVLQFVH